MFRLNERQSVASPMSTFYGLEGTNYFRNETILTICRIVYGAIYSIVDSESDILYGGKILSRTAAQFLKSCIKARQPWMLCVLVICVTAVIFDAIELF